jgi:FixJ family two-component response regulator
VVTDANGVQGRLRVGGQELPIIFMTGHSDIVMRLQAMRAVKMHRRNVNRKTHALSIARLLRELAFINSD